MREDKVMSEKDDTKSNDKKSQNRGPFGYGDPDDKTLRKTERDIIIPKMILERAIEKCPESMKKFLDCAKEAGLLFNTKCKVEIQAKNDCIVKWGKNEEFVKEITDKYLEARSHYRRTGQPLIKYDRLKRKLESVPDSSIS